MNILSELLNTYIVNLLNPYFYLLLLPVIFLSEYFFGLAFYQGRLIKNITSIDAIWYLFSPLLQFIFVLIPIQFLGILYSALSFPKFQQISIESSLLLFCIGLFFFDFLLWGSHWIRHKVSLFWFFHKLHHNIKNLGFFSSYRLHPFDLLIYGIILSLPIYMFSFYISAIFPYLFLLQWYTAFTHSPVRLEMKGLRFILVTPNSHRVHHSKRYANYNYGFVFSIWDRIFKTHMDQIVRHSDLGID